MKTKASQTNGNGRAHGIDARAFLQRLEEQGNPRFESADGRVAWEHVPLSLEALILIKELPGTFTAALSTAYEGQLNKAFGGQVKEAERPALNAPDFVAGMQQLVISTAVSPRFHDGEDDLDSNLLNVARVRPYLQEYFTYSLESAANGPVRLTNGSEVSANALKEFPAGAAM